jgi:glycosyltransferase 2 family protein
MPYLTAIPRRHLLTIAKVLVSIAAIVFIVSRFDLPLFLSHWQKLSVASVLIVLGVLAIETTLVAGMRLKLVLTALGAHVPLARTSQIALCGFFVEQVAFGFVGGDAMRLWLLHRTELPFRKAVEALVIDRGVGFAALLLLVLAGLPGFLDLVPSFGQPIIFIVGISALAVAGSILLFLLVGRTRYRGNSLRVEIVKLCVAVVRNASVRRCFLLVFALACLTHLMNVLVFFVVGQNLGLPVLPAQWFFIVPPALLFSMIPISAGGWGLREGVLIFALGELGIPAEEAIVPSLIFGLGILLVTLPGALVWLANRKPDAADDRTQSLMPAIEEDISGTLGSMKVGSAGDNFTGRPLS